MDLRTSCAQSSYVLYDETNILGAYWEIFPQTAVD